MRSRLRFLVLLGLLAAAICSHGAALAQENPDQPPTAAAEQAAGPNTLFLPLVADNTPSSPCEEADECVAYPNAVPPEPLPVEPTLEPWAEGAVVVPVQPEEWQSPAVEGEAGQVVVYDMETGEETLLPAAAGAGPPGELLAAFAEGGGPLPSPYGSMAPTAPMEEGELAPSAFGGFSQVTANSDPWMRVVRLFVKFDEQPNYTYWCTGALFKPSWVMTDADCVYDKTMGYASSIKVVPAYESGKEPYGAAFATRNLNTFSQWRSSQNLAYSISWFQIDRPLGARVGWFGYGYEPANSFFTSNNFDSPGYPSEQGYNGELLYNRRGKFDTVVTDFLYHNTYKNYGAYSSGSPAFGTAKDGSPERIFGLHTCYRGTESCYVRITASKFDDIKAGIDADTPAAADLIPLLVEVAKTSVDPGQSISSYSYMLHNGGRAAWNGSVTTKVYLSNDQTITTRDTLLLTHKNSRKLPSLASDWFTGPAVPIPAAAKPGTYYIGVIIEAADAAGGNNTVTVYDVVKITVTTPPPPVLKVSPATLSSFDAVADGSAPAGQRLSISFDGVVQPDWTATSNVNWITLRPASGTGKGYTDVTINTAGMAPGTYDGKVTINAPKAKNTKIEYAVKLTLKPATLSLSPTPVLLDALIGASQPVTRAVMLTFSGGAKPEWTTISGAEWLSVQPNVGTGGGMITLVANPQGLVNQAYSGSITFNWTQYGVVYGQTLPVTLTVGYGSGTLLVEPAALSFSAVAGGQNPPAQPLALTGGARGWTAIVDQPWLLLDDGAGVLPDTLQVQPNISGLAPGVYNANIVLSSGEGLSKTVPVALTLGDANAGVPLLQIQPTQLRFEGVVGQAAPADAAVGIANLGGGAMPWSATASQTWITLDRSEGADAGVLRIGVNPAGLAAGNHSGEVTILAPGAAASPQVIGVALRMQNPPTLAIDGSQLVFTGVAGEAALPAQDFVVRNGGGGSPLAWQAAEEIPWLDLDKLNGGTPTQVRATINPAGLTPGSYSGVINVSAADAAGSPREIQVKLHLAPGPQLALSAQTLYLDIEAGASVTFDELSVKNAALGNLQWTASEEINWLSLGAAGGTVNAYSRQALPLVVNAAGLTPRAAPYTGKITVASPNGDGSPQTVQVKLTVSSKARYCRIQNGGTEYIINNSRVKMWMEGVQITPLGGGCDLSAKVFASLPQNGRLEFNVQGRVDENNNLTASANINLDLGVAEVRLNLSKDIRINDLDGFVADGGSWQFSKRFGGKKYDFNEEVRIGPKGLVVAGNKEFTLPDLNWGGFKLTENKGSVSGSSDGKFLFTLSGLMHIEVGGAGSQARLSVVLDERGIRRSQIADFTLSGIAGLDMEVKNGKMQQDSISADVVRLRVPKAWGGGEVAVYQLVITNSGKISIGGGRFRLPDLKVGGDAFRLASLEGEFQSIAGGGYRIRAMGAFGMSGISDVGDCRIWVDVEMETTKGGASMLTLSTPEATQTLVAQPGGGVTPMYAAAPSPDIALAAAAPDSLDALRLNRLTLGVRCTPGWAIGTTGFFLTGVEGTIELGTRLEKISVKVWVESGVRFGSIAAISAVPQLTIRPKPFAVDFESTTYVLRVPAEKVKAHLDRRSFSAEFTYNYVLVHASLGVSAGRDQSNDFYLRGTGRAEVGIEKGALVSECISYPAPTLRNPGRTLKSCLNIPDAKYTLGGVDAAIDLNGMDLSIKVAGVRGTMRWDFESGSLSFRRGLFSAAITGEDVAAARGQWEAAQRGEITMAAVDSRFAFGPEGDVTIAYPVAWSLAQTAPGGEMGIAGAVEPFTTSVQSDAIFGIVQPPDGLLQVHLIDPAGNEYTPDRLGANMQYFQSTNISGTQMVYSVLAAQPGTWKMKVVGDTVNNGFHPIQMWNSPPPAFGQARLEAAPGNPDARNIVWQVLAADPNTRVSIYANPEPVTQTMTYTAANGELVTAVSERFTGVPLAMGLTSALDGSLQQQAVSLAQLPSGSYTIWLEATAGDGMAARCYIRADGLDCNRTGAPAAPLVIERSASFPATWTPAFDVVTDIQGGEITLGWTPIDHPDVDEYLVQVRTTDPLSPSVEVVNEFTVGTSTSNGLVSTVISNIEPGQRYVISVQALDVDSGRAVWSGQQVIDAPQPSFVVSGPPAPPLIAVGGEAQSVLVTVSLSSELPYPVALAVDEENVADGLYIDVADTLISAAALEAVGATEATVALLVSTSDTLEPGSYVLPLIASSGRFSSRISLPVEVSDVLGAAGGALYLPLINR